MENNSMGSWESLKMVIEAIKNETLSFEQGIAILFVIILLTIIHELPNIISALKQNNVK